MTNYHDKTSAADIAAVWAIVFLAAVVAILVGIYFARQYGFLGFNGGRNTAANDSPHINVIGGEDFETTEYTVIPPSETAAVEITEHTSEESAASEISAAEIPDVPTDYDAEFFDKALMIGDSLSVGFINYGYLEPENVFAQVGLTPASVMTAEIDGESVYSKAEELDPACICIMLGTNGLSYLSEDYMAEKLGEFIDALRLTCPDSVIVLVSIPPVTEEHESEKPEKLENIIKYNDHIKRLAEDKSAAFTDIFTLLRDSTGYLAEHYAESDGLHFKTYAYPVILSAVQTSVSELLPQETIAAAETVSTVTETFVEAVPETITETAAVSVYEPITDISSETADYTESEEQRQ